MTKNIWLSLVLTFAIAPFAIACDDDDGAEEVGEDIDDAVEEGGDEIEDATDGIHSDMSFGPAAGSGAATPQR